MIKGGLFLNAVLGQEGGQDPEADRLVSAGQSPRRQVLDAFPRPWGFCRADSPLPAQSGPQPGGHSTSWPPCPRGNPVSAHRAAALICCCLAKPVSWFSFPSPLAVKCGTPQTVEPIRPLCPWNSPGQNTGVGSHALLQGIFPTQALNPGLPHGRQTLYRLSHQVCPLISGLPSASGGLSQQTRAPLIPLQPRQPGPWQSLHKRAQLSHPTPVRRLGTQELKSLARPMTVKTRSQNLTQRGHSPTRRTSVSISRRATQPPPGVKAAPTPARCKCSGGTCTPRHSKWQNQGFFLSPISLGQVHLL